MNFKYETSDKKRKKHVHSSSKLSAPCRSFLTCITFCCLLIFDLGLLYTTMDDNVFYEIYAYCKSEQWSAAFQDVPHDKG